ncbi:DUF2000 domain-containing protein [Cohaesibacter haloalkalitolerans]|uniref:DUF2000 domain-containing protein n=1 Tax=Cohaesibacter haloalkalitolerans TaxID=1162980 RepID=UPI000E657A1A|nr:DUF2000 domain-containing protein [Cohaesibacter haloalkalitolerans]
MLSDLRLAIVINPDMPVGLIANTASAIAIGLGARQPLLAGRSLADQAGRSVDVSSCLPVPILQATQETMGALLLKALGSRDDVGAVVPFPAFARSLHDYADYEKTFPDRDLSGEPIDGLGLVGPTKWIRSLTGSLKLLR